MSETLDPVREFLEAVQRGEYASEGVPQSPEIEALICAREVDRFGYIRGLLTAAKMCRETARLNGEKAMGLACKDEPTGDYDIAAVTAVLLAIDLEWRAANS